jgi:hypothetical protein
MEFGNLDGGLCANLGEIFNPLTEPPNRYGKVNPYVDPTRGFLEHWVGSADGEYNDSQDLEQNLAGPDTLIGRSFVLKYTEEVEDEDVITTVGCCVIGRDAVPEPKAPAYDPWRQPYGGYGGRGYGKHPRHNPYNNYYGGW